MLRKLQVLKENKHRKYVNNFLEPYVLVPAIILQQLPTKLHKSPYDSRFIGTSNICTTKPSCLSLVMTNLKTFG